MKRLFMVDLVREGHARLMVVAEDEDHALEVAEETIEEAIDNSDEGVDDSDWSATRSRPATEDEIKKYGIPYADDIDDDARNMDAAELVATGKVKP